MGCTDAYLQEHACNIPWMPDEAGECTVLIEDHINARGPSRGIFTAYQVAVAFLCLVLNCQNLAEVLENARFRRQHHGLDILTQPQVLRLVALIYGTFMVILQAVDVHGYGGRLSYVVWLVIEDQASFGLLAAIVVTLCTWYTVLHGGQADEASEQRRRVVTTRWWAVVCMGLGFLVLPVLETFLIPADAPWGVTNGPISAFKTLLISGFVGVMTGHFTVEYRSQARARSELNPRRTPESLMILTRHSSRHFVVRTAGARDAGDAMRSGISRQASHAGTNSEMDDAFHRQPASRPSRAFGAVPSEGTLHQMRKLLFAGWVTTAFGLAIAIMKVKASRRCWTWDNPPDTQWFDLYILDLLLAAALFTLVPMKTQWLCLHDAEESRIVPLDPASHGYGKSSGKQSRGPTALSEDGHGAHTASLKRVPDLGQRPGFPPNLLARRTLLTGPRPAAGGLGPAQPFAPSPRTPRTLPPLDKRFAGPAQAAGEGRREGL